MVFRRTSILFVVVLAGLLASVAAEARPDGKRAPVRRLTGTTLLANGSFEGTLAGWSGWNATLGIASSGSVGTRSARVSVVRKASSYAVSSSSSPVPAAVAGTVYRLQASIRTEKTGRETCARVREWSGTRVVGSALSCAVATAAWQRLAAAAYTALENGTQISVDVFVRSALRGDTFLVDDVLLTAAAPAEPAPAPAPGPAPAPAPTACAKYAGPSGSDSAAGTLTDPFRTAQNLVNRLVPGETGCLLPGSYAESVTIRTGGSPGSPITLTSASERASLVGRLWIADSANDVVFTNLLLDGRTTTLPSPTVNGDRVTFRDNEVTNAHTAICFVLGDGEGPYGIAVDPVIEGNRIHDCGKLPATNHDHGIYVEASRNARITGNVIYDNADRGIQLYPDAQNTLITGNVLDGNGSGVIFSGDFGIASNGNVVRGNVISNSILRANVESWYPAGNPVGTGNLVEANCVWNGRQGDIDGSLGFTARNNLITDPLFTNRAAKDFTLRAGSPCAALLVP